MTQAMAWRAKYRKTYDDGTTMRYLIRIDELGVHPLNRCGVYPSGERCKSLCEHVLDVGFLKEEVDQNVVVVEEAPAEEIRSRGNGYISASKYNRDASMKDELLVSCFKEPHHHVLYKLLGHNHIVIVLRAFRTGAKWELKVDANKISSYADAAGRLSPAAVADSPNGKQLREVLDSGLNCEVLSWKMDVEEPTAASIISQALNKGHELAMRTTELTAVAVLKGEIIVQKNKDISQRVAFQTVRDAVRAQLHEQADDPDLADVFTFLIESGVGKNSYVDDLLEFAQRYVDSKLRRLRLAASGL